MAFFVEGQSLQTTCKETLSTEKTSSNIWARSDKVCRHVISGYPLEATEFIEQETDKYFPPYWTLHWTDLSAYFTQYWQIGGSTTAVSVNITV
jgi:hypothetical protein